MWGTPRDAQTGSSRGGGGAALTWYRSLFCALGRHLCGSSVWRAVIVPYVALQRLLGVYGILGFLRFLSFKTLIVMLGILAVV